MRKLVLAFVAISMLLAYACTQPPRGIVAQSAPQQQNLLPSPWPAYAHDAQHTGRGAASGPKEPNIRWKFKVDNAITSFPVVSGDGTVYFCSGENKLYAVDAWGNRLWEKVTEGYVDRCLALAPDGTIYYGTSSGVFGALEPDGREKWKLSLGEEWCYDCFIDGKSRIYVNSGGNLYALLPEGTAKMLHEGISAVALAPDGTIYAISSDRKLLAINPDGKVLWCHDDKFVSPASVDSEGTLYPCGTVLYAINRDGSTKWKCKEVSPVAAPAAIAPDGTLYAPSFDSLHGVTREGKKIWDFWMSTELQDSLRISPIIDADGTAYVGTYRGKFYAIDKNGKKKWCIGLGEEIDASAAMGADGTLYVPAGNRLFAIGTALPKQTAVPSGQQESSPEYQQQSAKPPPAPKQLLKNLKKAAEELLKSLASEKYNERERATKKLGILLVNSGRQWVPLVKWLRNQHEKTQDPEVKRRLKHLLGPNFGPWKHFGKLHTLKLHTRDVTSVAFSPDGKLLASASLDRTVRIWNPSTGKCLRTLEGHEDWVWSVCFSPDSKTLATASEDKTIRLWNPATGTCLQTLREHNGYVNSVAFSPDGKLLASGSRHFTVRLWNPQTGQCVRTIAVNVSNQGARTVLFSPDGKLLIAGAGWRAPKILIWNAGTGELVREIEGGYIIALSPDGKLLASAGHDGKVGIWAPGTRKQLRTLSHEYVVRSLAFSPDGLTLAVAGTGRCVTLWGVPEE